MPNWEFAQADWHPNPVASIGHKKLIYIFHIPSDLTVNKTSSPRKALALTESMEFPAISSS
jgi:hypothetical protein